MKDHIKLSDSNILLFETQVQPSALQSLLANSTLRNRKEASSICFVTSYA